MSERVSNTRIENLRDWLAVHGDPIYRDASLALDELLQRRATDRPDDAERYESELRRLSEFVQSRHPSGAVKHIGLMEAAPAAMELISEASEWIGRHVQPDDSEPITAEWLESVGFYREADYGGDDGWLAKDFDDGTPDWLTVNPSESEVTIINDGGGSITRDCITRGDLRRLWQALTGRKLPKAKGATQ